LLAVVEYPEEVIAITFTRKAAAEMQLRVLEALRRRQSGDEPEEAHEQQTDALAGQALARSDKLNWNLIGNPRRMRILTLDALNASIARAQPLSSPGGGARVVVGAELQAIHQAASMATLDWLAEEGAMQAATVEVLQHVDNNTWVYASYLSQMLGTRDQWLPFVGSGLLTDSDADLLREKFEASLEFAVSEHLQRTAARLDSVLYADLCELLDYAASNMLDTGVTGSAICGLAGITELPAPVPEEIEHWSGVAELLLTQQGQFRKRVDKRQGFPAGDKAKKDMMHALLETLASDFELAESLHGVLSLPPLKYTDEQWQVLLALFRILFLTTSKLRFPQTLPWEVQRTRATSHYCSTTR